VLIAATPANGVTFQYRDTPGGSTVVSSSTPGLTVPYYLYLQRIGDTLNGWYSTDGVNFTEQDSVRIPLGSTVYVGLAVTSHNPAVIGNGWYSLVSTTGLIGSLAGTYNTLAIPEPPTLSLGTGTGVTVNWSNVAGNSGYAVERSTDGATWSQIGTTSADVTTYADNGLAGSYRYYYRVSALGSGSRSAPSGVSGIVDRPSAPPLAGVPIFSVSTSALVINWRNVSGDTGYRIERSTDGVNFTSIATVGVNVVAYYNTGLAAATRYYYRIIALSPYGDSPPSAVANGTTRGGLAPTPPPPNGKRAGDGGKGMADIAILPPLHEPGRRPPGGVAGDPSDPLVGLRTLVGTWTAFSGAIRRRTGSPDLLWEEMGTDTSEELAG
jgi:hypothetical protein